jgi:hypothetical protein
MTARKKDEYDVVAELRQLECDNMPFRYMKPDNL